VFNTYQLQEWFDYDGPQIVCHPILVPDEYATTPGDSITLVNLLPEKGVHVLDKIARHMPDRHFIAVRGGYSPGHQSTPYRPNIEIVPHTGNMRDDVYSRSRIVIMPSLFESFGLVGLEAYCSGIPVIAHPTDGLMEALGPAGIWADRAVLEEWLTAIERLDDKRHYNAASRKAKQCAAEVAAEDGPERFVKAVESLA
jgi:glycosyltransferase involved in cell wall biosynthesis